MMMGKYFLKLVVMAMLVCCQSSDDDNAFPIENLPANNWDRDVNNPVLESVDTLTNISDPTVIYQGKFQMWAGCVGTDVTFASICYSESTDGINWSDPIVVFTPSTAAEGWDNQKTEIPTVIYDEDEADVTKRYKMWYGGANRENRDLIKIGYAYSEDGINWNRLPACLSLDQQAGLVLVPGFEVGDAGVVSDPTSVIKNGTYHIWYNSFGANNDIMISHATSSNGYEWIKDTSNPVMIPEVNWEDQGPGDITKDVSHPVVLVDNNDGIISCGLDLSMTVTLKPTVV